MNELFRIPEIDIRNLTVEVPAAETVEPFDPERDVRAEDWQKILENLERMRQDNHSVYYHHLANAVTLFPERRDELLHSPNLRSELRRLLDEKTLNFLHDRVRDQEYLEFVREYRLLAPDLVNFSSYYDQVKDQFLTFPRVTPPNEEYFDAIANANQAFPGKFDALIEIYWDGCLEGLAALQEAIGPEPHPYDSIHYAHILASLRLAAPDRLSELQPPAKIWQPAREVLVSEGNGWSTLLRDFLSLKIVAAEKIAVDDLGVTIILPQKRSEGSKSDPLPEQRKY